MGNYVLNLREKFGHQPLILAGSAIIVINSSNEILLQHRTDSNDWSLPGGGMEPGESFEETATRELFEETNLKCNELKFLQIFSGKQFHYKYPNGDESFDVIALFKALKFDGELNINDGENLNLKYFPINNFPDLEKRTKIILETIKL